MAYEKSKGLVALATEYSGGDYSYEKLDGYIQGDGYESTPDQRQDLDSYRNANGKLKRNVLPHTATKIEFNTRFMTGGEISELLKIIRMAIKLDDGTCNEQERKCRARYFNDFTREYSHGFFYIPDITFQIYGTFDGKPTYQPVRIALIEY